MLKRTLGPEKGSNRIGINYIIKVIIMYISD
jgi:hypothetical protein